MCLRKMLWFLLISLLANQLAFAQNESYLCVAENSVGFNFNKSTKKWERANFKAESKYLLSKASGIKKGWEVKEIGESSGTECSNGFNEYGFIECKGLIDFQMNNKSLRYILIHRFGYVVKEYSEDGLFKEGEVTPYIEIGKCSPL